jgi:hypothetical protein
VQGELVKLAVRVGPDDDPTEVTTAQLREVAGRLAAAGARRDDDPDILRRGVSACGFGGAVRTCTWLSAGSAVEAPTRR